MSDPIKRRSAAAAFAVMAVLVASFALAPQAGASTITVCVKKSSGAVRLITGKAKCKKGEKKLSWNSKGPAGANGTNGTNGAPGAAGQPQSAVVFSSTLEAPLFGEKSAGLFSLSGVTVTIKCVNVLVVNAASIEGVGPAGTRAVSGMSVSRVDGTETESFQKPVYNVSLASTTAFASLGTNGKGTVGNEGHVDAVIITSTSAIFVSAFIEAAPDPNACTVTGSAYSVPRA